MEIRCVKGMCVLKVAGSEENLGFKGLSTYPSSLSLFMISKTHISAQQPRGRQLNAKVCGCKSAIFLILRYDHFVHTTITRKRFKYSPSFHHKTDDYHSAELYDHSASS